MQRLIRFQEEVTAEGDIGEGPVHHIEVHHHKFAAGDFVLAVVAARAVFRRKGCGSHAFHTPPPAKLRKTTKPAPLPVRALKEPWGK